MYLIKKIIEDTQKKNLFFFLLITGIKIPHVYLDFKSLNLSSQRLS